MDRIITNVVANFIGSEASWAAGIVLALAIVAFGTANAVQTTIEGIELVPAVQKTAPTLVATTNNH